MIRLLCSNTYNTYFTQKSFITDENYFIGLAMKPVAVSQSTHRITRCFCARLCVSWTSTNAYGKKNQNNRKMICVCHTQITFMDTKAVGQHPEAVDCPEGDAIFTMCTFRFKNYLPSKAFISCAWINFLLLLLLTHPRPILVHFSPLVPSFLSLPGGVCLILHALAVSSPCSHN